MVNIVFFLLGFIFIRVGDIVCIEMLVYGLIDVDDIMEFYGLDIEKYWVKKDSFKIWFWVLNFGD